MGEITERFVESGGGVRIAVYEEGNPDGPTVVLVHGWPDSHVVWDGVAPLLADSFHIVRYDNRGVGKTSVPKPISAYTMACYADDFAAVIDAVAPDEPVHVLAHDWGSAGMWEYLSRPGAGDHVASFTSVSGPSGDHLNRYIVGSLKRPYRPRQFLRALSQFLSFAYMGFFSIPVVGPLAVRGFIAEGVRRMLVLRDGIPPERLHHSPTYKTDAANSLKVYGANYFRSVASARTDHYVDVPVQVIVNTKDQFVRPHVYDDLKQWVPRLWRRDLRAGHWSPMSHPQVLASSVRELVEHLDGKPASRALLRAQVGRPREYFGDTVVSVTGAGSGIGRATALAFARAGARVALGAASTSGSTTPASRCWGASRTRRPTSGARCSRRTSSGPSTAPAPRSRRCAGAAAGHSSTSDRSTRASAHRTRARTWRRSSRSAASPSACATSCAATGSTSAR
jgi:pimeloyl-ACP methyl ester carboxylesterase